MRVANGEVQPEDTVFDTQFELTITKCNEIFAESIPSSVLQTYALLQASGVERAAVFLILSSASAIAFACSTISLDFDIDPVKRLNNLTYFVSFDHKH